MPCTEVTLGPAVEGSSVELYSIWLVLDLPRVTYLGTFDMSSITKNFFLKLARILFKEFLDANYGVTSTRLSHSWRTIFGDLTAVEGFQITDLELVYNFYGQFRNDLRYTVKRTSEMLL